MFSISTFIIIAGILLLIAVGVWFIKGRNKKTEAPKKEENKEQKL